MVAVRRGDESVVTFDVRGTAIDSSIDGEYLVVAGYRTVTVVSISSPSSHWARLKTNRQIVKQVQFHPKQNIFACVSGQTVDIYELARNAFVQKFASFSAHSRRISDFNWCPHDENLVVCCADQDTVSFWDIRDTTKPCAELKLVFGGSQAKFSPHVQHVLLTSHGCDLRLWDIRNTVHPMNQFTGHQSRIQCLQWNPQSLDQFVTSTVDGYVKLWQWPDQRYIPNMPNFKDVNLNAWRLVYSPEGDELANLTLPLNSEKSNNVTIFNSMLDLPSAQPLKNDDGDIIMDICWQKQVYKSTKYLYTLSKKHCLCRHPVAYELSSEMRDEMATPIAQTMVDEERDRLIAEHPDETNFDEAVIFSHYEKDPSMSDAPDFIAHKNLTFPGKFPHPSSVSGGSANLKRGGTDSADSAGRWGDLRSNSTNAPQSPISAEWSRWIRAPNTADGYLTTQLEALRKHTTVGLYTTEVNFNRAAIGFNYIHLNNCRKIYIEMRFHRNWIENGLVLVEIGREDSPLASEKAMLLLALLQAECDEQAKIPSVKTILARVLQQLPRLIESMKVFTPSIDVPNAQQTASSSLSGSYSEEQHRNDAESCDFIPSTSLKPSVVVPVTYTPSPFDRYVPAPRNCGARFNPTGFLVTFGRVNYAGASKPPRISKASVGGDSSSQPQLDTSYAHRRKSLQQYSRRVTEPLGGASYLTTEGDPISGEHSSKIEFTNDFEAMAPSSSEITRVIALPNTSMAYVGKVSGRRHGHSKSSAIQLLHGRTSENRTCPRSLADYCIFVAAPSQQQAIATSGPNRQKSTLIGSTHDYAEGTPAQRFSPVPGTSPCHSSTLSHHYSPTSIASTSSVNTIVAATVPCASMAQPIPSAATLIADSGTSSSILAQQLPHPSSRMGSPTSSSSVLNQAVASAILQRNNSTKSSVAKVLGSSPSPVNGAGSATTRSFSLQNVSSQNARLRGNSMTGGAAGATVTTASNLAPPVVEEHAVMPELSFSSTVIVYDVSGLLPVSKELARDYKLLGGSALDLCRYNLEQATKSSRKDLVKLWKLLEQCVAASNRKYSDAMKKKDTNNKHTHGRGNIKSGVMPSSMLSTPWSCHPLGRELINSLLDHYAKAFDIQTAAVITCVLGERRLNSSKRRYRANSRGMWPPTNGPSSTVLPYRKGIDLYTQNVTAALSSLFGSQRSASTSLASALLPNYNLVHGIARQQEQPYQVAAPDANFEALARTESTGSKLARSNSFDHDPLIIAVEEISMEKPPPRKSSNTIIMTPRLNLQGILPKLESISMLPPAGCSIACESLLNQPGGSLEVTVRDAGRSENTSGEKQENSLGNLFLDPALSHRFEDMRLQYADLLYRWGLYLKCAEVMKYCLTGEEDMIGIISEISWCSNCGEMLRHTQKCGKCKKPPICCAICEGPCYGAMVTCVMCSHGGHLSHMANWYESHSSCPLGCGCECKL